MLGSGMRCMQRLHNDHWYREDSPSPCFEFPSMYTWGRPPLPKVIIIQYEEGEYVISSWCLEWEGMRCMYFRIWRECLVLPHMKMKAMLTSYIKATIWRLISFSSFESNPFHPWGATMESVPHMAEEVRALTLMLWDLPHGCTRGSPLAVQPYLYGQFFHGCSPVGVTCARLGGGPTGEHPWDSWAPSWGAQRVNTRGTSGCLVGGPHGWTPVGVSCTRLGGVTGEHPWD
jgi:hypothetical protein